MTDEHNPEAESSRADFERERSAKFRALGREMQLRFELQTEKLEASARENNLRAELHATSQAAAQRERDLTNALQSLKQHSEAVERNLNDQLQAIVHSTSWKITQPLRDVTEWTRTHLHGSAADASPAGQTTSVETPDPRSEQIPSADLREAGGESGGLEAAAPAQSASQIEAALPAPPESDSKIATASAPAENSFLTQGRESWNQAGSQRLDDLLSGNQRLAFPETSQPVLSIILLLHNQANLTVLCLQSILRAADVAYELILVDNNSSDRTGELLQRLDNVAIIRNRENLGFGYACMQGAQQARGEYLCFLNNDAVLQAGSLSAALADFRESSAVGAVGGKILLADGRLQEAGSIVWADGSAWGYGRGDDPELPRYNFRRPVDYSSGAFLFTPRSLFQQLGGFDERFFPAYYEDADYCFKVWDSGLKVVYEPRAIIHHYESAASDSVAAIKPLIAEHQQKFCEKWSERLQQHAEREGAVVPRARFAQAAGGNRILCMGEALPSADDGTDAKHLTATVAQLAAEGHHITFIAMEQPIVPGGSNAFGSDVELADAASGSHYIFRELLSQYDVAWIRGRLAMQKFLQRMWNMYGRIPPLVYEAVSECRDGKNNQAAEAKNEMPPRIEDDAASLAAADVVVTASDGERELIASPDVSNAVVVEPDALAKFLVHFATRH